MNSVSNEKQENEIVVNDESVVNNNKIIVDVFRLQVNTKVETEKTELQPEINLRNRKNLSIYLPDCPEVDKGAPAVKRYFEIYAGPDFIFRNFSDTAHSAYLQKRKESTKITSAFSAGFRYSKNFKNGMGIKAGLNYSQINEQFSYVQSNLVQVTYIIDPDTGDTTGSYTITGTRKKVSVNRYRSIDIPLVIGYELGNGRLHVNINAGALINIYSWQKGNILDTALLPVSITTGKASSSYQFKNNVGVALTGGAAFYYKITDQMHIMAEPYFRYNLKPMSKDNLTLKQKYNALGLHVGVRFDIP